MEGVALHSAARKHVDGVSLIHAYEATPNIIESHDTLGLALFT